MTSAVPPSATVPSSVGPYRITGTLGSGGMGVVYRGQRGEQRVAVKTVRIADASMLACLRREVRALTRLRHPGIVRIVDEGIEANFPYYAMELLEGVTLAELLSSAWSRARSHAETRMIPTRIAIVGVPFGEPVSSRAFSAIDASTSDAREVTERSSSASPPSSGPGSSPMGVPPRGTPLAPEQLARLLTLVRRLCDTLAYLHGEGIVHRDLKPGNVFVGEAGTPTLMDFGLVQTRGLGREVLDVGTLAGTPAYMAPEQLRGSFVDARSDLYAVGCMLYEVLTGSLPFEGGLVEKLTRTPAPPSRIVGGVPPALDGLVLRLLAARPADRVGHASDVSAALAELGAEPWPVPIPDPEPYVYRPELVGRDGLVRELEGRVADAVQGRGALVIIRGESGIGKTYLALAAARHGVDLGATVLTGSCLSLGVVGDAQTRANDAPLHPFTPFFQHVADECLLGGDAFALSFLGDRAKVLAECEPALGRIPGVEATADPPALTAQAARERLREAVGATLSAVAARRPLILVLDDLQWADELTLELLATRSAAFFAESPLLIVGTWRAEDPRRELDALASRGTATILDVGRVDQFAVTAMVSAMLATPRVPPSFAAFLAVRSEGNPFFVVEYLRTAVQQRVLTRDASGRFRLPEQGLEERISAPGSLRELVGQRLSALGPTAREIVSVAAVLGREFDVGIAADLAGLPDAEWLDGLRELLVRQVIEESGGAFRFMHDKLREVAHDAIAPERRRAWHLRAGLALETRHRADEGFPRHFAQLARHFLEAGDRARGADYLERAGDRALQTFSNREAQAHFTELCALGGEKTGSALQDGGLRLDMARWERKLADAAYALGDVNAMTEHATAALGWAGIAPPVDAKGWVVSLLRNLPEQVAHRWAPGRAVSRDPVRRALAREASAAMQRLAQRSYYSDAVAMIGGALWAVNLAERADGEDIANLPYAMVGLTAGIGGLASVAERYFARARAAAAKNSDPVGDIIAGYLDATWKSGTGRFAAAWTLLEEALEQARRSGDRNEATIAHTILGNTAFFLGRFQASDDALAAVLASGERQENRQHVAWGCYGRARALIPLGRWDEARPLLERGREVLEPQIELPSKIICWALLAREALHRGDVGAALAAAEAALARIRENQLIAYAIAPAYEDVFSVFHAAGQTPGRVGGRARSSARAVLAQLEQLSLVLPIAAPYRDRARAAQLVAVGLRSGARHALASAIERSRSFGMPYEEARARAALARLLPAGSPEQRREASGALEMFAAMGCPPL